MAADNIPKQDLLLKILNMSTSDNDGTALVAIRKANELLASAGWSWEKLLSGKITVVADPFARMPEVKRPEPIRESPDAVKPAYRAPPPQRPSHPPFADIQAAHARAAAQSRATTPKSKISSQTNQYPGFCYICGCHVNAQDGFAFQPSDHNYSAPKKWAVICKSDNSIRSSDIRSSAAPRKQVTLDLHASIRPDLNSL